MRGGCVILGTLLVAAAMPFGGAAETDDPQATCISGDSGVTMETLSRAYPGETVKACFAYPASGKAGVTKLVVFAHGLDHTVQASWVGHMTETVLVSPGTAALAMNYRDNFGFPIFRGAEDLLRFTEDAKAQLPALETTFLFGVSMGGGVSGTAIHIAPTYTGDDQFFDYWFAVEPMSNLFETYAEAKAAGAAIEFAAVVAEDIERETDGVPGTHNSAYALRSPVFNTREMRAAGLRQALVFHATNDGLVPYDQGQELAAALAAARIPVEFTTVTRGDPGHTAGTTPTKHLKDSGFPSDPNEESLHLAGHASEADRDHVVMDLAMERLFEFLDGDRLARQVNYVVYDDSTGFVGLSR